MTVLALTFGYLLGSIPFGLLLIRAAGGPDIRAIGSGNIGATNVLRTGRRGLAAATLLCDALKGTVAVLMAAHFGTDAGLMAGLGAFLGHLFPVWLRFKGGKGFARSGSRLHLPFVIHRWPRCLPAPSRLWASGYLAGQPSPPFFWFSHYCCGSGTGKTSYACSKAPKAKSTQSPWDRTKLTVV